MPGGFRCLIVFNISIIMRVSCGPRDWSPAGIGAPGVKKVGNVFASRQRSCHRHQNIVSHFFSINVKHCHTTCFATTTHSQSLFLVPRVRPRHHRTLHSSSFQKRVVCSSGGELSGDAQASKPLLSPWPALLLTVGAVVCSGIANRLLYKMALVPLGNYIFFLSQLQTFGYLLVYFGALWFQWRNGEVSFQMLSIPRRMVGTFLAIGFVEALSSLLGFYAAQKLPGVLLPLLSQTILFWQVLLAYLVLGKSLGGSQLLGMAFVMLGVSIAGIPAHGGAALLDGVNPWYAAMFVLSMFFPAVDTILKEKVFKEGKKWCQGQDVNLFVVNSFGSLSQAFFVLALLPVLTAARGMSLKELPQYLAAGWTCFLGGSPACGSDCSGSPILPLMYVAFNLAFNIAALRLLRQAGNVVLSLVMSSIVPMTLFAFTLPLPYLGSPPTLGPMFFWGSLTLMMGLGVYNAALWMPVVKRQLYAFAASRKGDWGNLQS